MTAPTAERITYHKVLCLAQSVENKPKLSKQIKEIGYHVMAQEMTLRKLRELIANDAPKAEIIGVIDTATGKGEA